MNMPEITTIILAGGTASRMRPLSLNQTKCMIPFLGKPLIFHLINSLKAYGFTDLVLTSKGRRGEIKEYFSMGKKWGLKIRYYKGKKWFGTAGTIKELVAQMNKKISDPFMVIYGDSLLRVDYSKMLKFHYQKKSKATLLYHRPDFASFLYEYHDKQYERRGKRTNYGVMDITQEDKIIKAKEKPTLGDIKRNFIDPVANATVHIFDKEILNYIPTDEPFDFPRDLFPLLTKKGQKCYGYNIGDGYRIDIGTIRHYYDTQFDILNRNIIFDINLPELENGIWVGAKSKIKSLHGLKKPVLIGEKCRISSRNTIDCSIIGNNVRIGNDTLITGSIILDGVQIGDKVNISHCIIGENTVINNGVIVPPNSVLGDWCHVG